MIHRTCDAESVELKLNGMLAVEGRLLSSVDRSNGLNEDVGFCCPMDAGGAESMDILGEGPMDDVGGTPNDPIGSEPMDVGASEDVVVDQGLKEREVQCILHNEWHQWHKYRTVMHSLIHRCKEMRSLL